MWTIFHLTKHTVHLPERHDCFVMLYDGGVYSIAVSAARGARWRVSTRSSTR